MKPASLARLVLLLPSVPPASDDVLVLAASLLSGCGPTEPSQVNTTWWCPSGGAIPTPARKGTSGHDRLCSDEEVQMARENGWIH